MSWYNIILLKEFGDADENIKCNKSRHVEGKGYRFIRKIG